MNGLEAEFGDEITFLRLNAAEVEVVELQQSYGLRGHPAVAVLDEREAVVVRYFGPESFDTLQAVLKDLLEE
ncbi:hypothetical protein [Candidatus Leptofilum sp.]|uniref:hypothetical protein n=1 Tax=Candidatus Leptofilum sp. TaxID=3241576 RepID=UPI003B5BF4B2